MGEHHQVFDDRPKRESRDEAEGADDHDDADQPGHEERRVRGQGAGAGRDFLLLDQRAGNGQGRNASQ